MLRREGGGRERGRGSEDTGEVVRILRLVLVGGLDVGD